MMRGLNDFIVVDWTKVKKAVAENKEKCVTHVKNYIQLGLKYRTKGVTVFQNQYDRTDNVFEKIALEMRVNGDCEEYAFNVLSNIINCSEYEPLEYFYDIISFQFMILEYEESVPVHIVIKMLSSYLGISIFNEMLSEYKEYFH